MSLPPGATAADHELARSLAESTGRALVELRREAAHDGLAASELRARGDEMAHDLLLASLRAAAPGDPVLSEEGDDDPHARVASRRVWIVDPLDGTREFGESARDDWAVHVALAVDGAPAAGAVALPARGVVLSTAEPPPRRGQGSRPPRVVVSRTRAPALVEGIVRRLGAAVIPMGSAGAKVAAVVEGRADAYVHAGGQYQWDSCAPVAVALAAGLDAVRLDGSPLVYNDPDPALPDLVVCTPDLTRRVLEAIAADW